MVVYKLYSRDEQKKEYFISLLPERRKDQERITEESLVNWSRIVLGEKAEIDFNSIYFVQTEF